MFFENCIRSHLFMAMNPWRRMRGILMRKQKKDPRLDNTVVSHSDKTIKENTYFHILFESVYIVLNYQSLGNNSGTPKGAAINEYN